jgi:hypothetical protein
MNYMKNFVNRCIANFKNRCTNSPGVPNQQMTIPAVNIQAGESSSSRHIAGYAALFW